jgi:tetratricopeptide (TPR) repeat protein
MHVTIFVRRAAAALVLTTWPLGSQAAVGAAKGLPAPAHYSRCLADSSSDPAAALADAQAWAKTGGGVPAEQCAALALVSLKRFTEAGNALDKLAGGRDAQSAEFRVSLFDQAGNAWLLAGDGARAVRSFSNALTLSAGDADLFADLARAQAMIKNWHEVDLDLNAALTLSPRRADLLVLRASARRALAHLDEARVDIETALKLKPGDSDALVERGLLRKQIGDLGGARRDFQAALKNGSGSAAASAKQNLDALRP